VLYIIIMTSTVVVCEQRTTGQVRREVCTRSEERRTMGPLGPEATLRQRLTINNIVAREGTDHDAASGVRLPQQPSTSQLGRQVSNAVGEVRSYGVGGTSTAANVTSLHGHFHSSYSSHILFLFSFAFNNVRE
jgi:hypothetical protein